MWFRIFKTRKFIIVAGVLLLWQFIRVCHFHAYSASCDEQQDWFKTALEQHSACVTNRSSYGVDLKDQKLILFWTPSFDCDHYDLPSGGNSLMDDEQFTSCPHRQCYFQYDRRDLNRSDAVVFHAPDMSLNSLPKSRLRNQLWAFMTLEPQLLTDVDLSPFNSMFNMSMTFRRDSDVYTPYGRVVNLNDSKGLLPLPPVESANRKALVAWTVSNCKRASSERNLIVQELQEYLQVDIYGKCGNFSCPPGGDHLSCYKFQASKYKFYLSFENSLCEDYITEKFYNALYVGMVPIVYGYGDYSRVAPRGSYIDATSFATVKNLAQYLSYLDDHPKEYQKYLDWRKHFTVNLGAFANGWCKLCTYLWTSAAFLRPESKQESHQYHLLASSTPTAAFNSSVAENTTFIIKSLSKWWYSHSRNKPDIGIPRSKSACIKPQDLAWWDGAFISNFKQKSSPQVIFGPISKLTLACLLVVAGAIVAAICQFVIHKCVKGRSSKPYSALKA